MLMMTKNPEDLAIAKSSVAISSAHRGGAAAVDDEPCGCAAGTFSSQLRTRCFLIIFPHFASVTADHCDHCGEDNCGHCGEDHYDVHKKILTSP